SGRVDYGRRITSGGGGGGHAGGGGLAFGGADGQQGAAVPGHVRGTLAADQHVVEPRADLSVVVEAEHLGLGQLAGQLGAVPFGQAADGGNLGARGGRGEQFVDGLLLGRLDEAAGIHQHHAGVVVGGQLPAGRGQPRRELFGIDLVARAAQRDQADGPGGGQGRRRRRH